VAAGAGRAMTVRGCVSVCVVQTGTGGCWGSWGALGSFSTSAAHVIRLWPPGTATASHVFGRGVPEVEARLPAAAGVLLAVELLALLCQAQGLTSGMQGRAQRHMRRQCASLCRHGQDN
jgi:hypothetical protein